MTIHSEVLDNGLQVILKEIHTVPVISHWVWYRVGSRNEKEGYKGISHWVEHMQFKGTEKFPPNMLDKMISRFGGYWNAFTYLDWTAYFQVLPADKIQIALELEADRMKNSRYVADEVESERTVIISELEGNENDPMSRLSRSVQNASFNEHPYHYEVIGRMDDLQNITRDDLHNYYSEHYRPGNAVLTMAGDFDTAEILKRIKDLYPGEGAVQKNEVLPSENRVSEETFVDMDGPGETKFIRMAYRAPSGAEEDFFKFTILDSVLTGPTSLNMFGGGSITNRTSRLYQQIVTTQHAVSVSGGLQATIDPYLYPVNFVLHNGQSIDDVMELYDQEIDRLQQEKISDEELQRAIKQAKALFAYGTESITNQAYWLGHASMIADASWFDAYISRLEAVTREDVLEIARNYLKRENRVVGRYIPNENGRQ